MNLFPSTNWIWHWDGKCDTCGSGRGAASERLLLHAAGELTLLHGTQRHHGERPDERRRWHGLTVGRLAVRRAEIRSNGARERKTDERNQEPR